jgi:signal transduction histidine kinase
MPVLEITEKNSLQRQINLLRVVSVLLAIALAPIGTGRFERQGLELLAFYLVVATAVVLVEFVTGRALIFLPPWLDLFVGLSFLIAPASYVSACCLFFVCVYALVATGKSRQALAVTVVALLAAPLAGWLTIVLDAPVRRALGTRVGLSDMALWFLSGLSVPLSAAAAWLLGQREHAHLVHRRLVDKIISGINFERGLSEAVHQTLTDLAVAFGCERACLMFQDEELERLYLWKVSPPVTEIKPPDTYPQTRADALLADCLEVNGCWNGLEGKVEGFGWDRRTGVRVKSLPQPPASTATEYSAKSLMAASIEADGRPSGRLVVVNPRRKFRPADLRELEAVAEQVQAPLENMFLARHMRSRAVESERGRISRDLHDGTLQTLLSFQIQLDVLRRKLPQVPLEKVAEELDSLREIVKAENEDLRRFVTEMRPVRVESADLREMMTGFAQRYRMESGVGLDLFIEEGGLRVPDRICRELFQIYRESLNNIKKHANASHVVVKLGQDEAKVSLVVDDNGHGFSFTGRFTSEELDRLRLGPISIKERTRGMGGALTVESNPGHGARLTVEIPLS